MESIGVLMTCPMYTYLEHQLEANFNLIKLGLHQPSELLLLQSQVRAIVGNTKFGAPSELIEALPNLEIVATFSVGLDKIDLAKCKERGIRVANTPDVLTDDVADLAIGLALCVLRRVYVGDGFVKGGKWVCGGEPQLGSKFSGRSVGILGLGRIGTAIARRAEAFGCPISYHSRSQKPHVNYKYYTTPIDLAKNCQILTEETHHIVNREVIDALGPKGVLINVGRGAHVDEDELVSALLEGRLGGAGLDVYASEPEVPTQLLGLDNVVLLPHVGSDTTETSNAMADLVVANLQAHFSNRPLLTPVL